MDAAIARAESAEAALADARRKAIEEAAEVVDGLYRFPSAHPERRIACAEAVGAIRALLASLDTKEAESAE